MSETTVSEQMVRPVQGGELCDHRQRLPLYFVGGTWCCDRCVEFYRERQHEAWMAELVKADNPCVFAVDLVAERVRRPLSLVETVAIRRNPRLALRLVGVPV